MKRAHQAMLDSRSTDLLTLAPFALQGAIRNESDLLDLLPPERPKPTPGARGRRLRNGHAAEAALA